MGYWQASDESVNTGNGSNGWPIFGPRIATAMVAQFYDQQDNTTGTNFDQKGGEQPIATLPVWTSLYVTIDNVTFAPMVDGGVTQYSQNLSIRNGIVMTSMVWRGVRLNYTVLAHRKRPSLGIVRLEIEPLNGSVEVTITDMLDGAGSWRTTFNSSSVDPTMHQLVTSVKPNGISNVSCFPGLAKSKVTGVEFSTLDVIYRNGSDVELSNVSGFNVTPNSLTVSQGYKFIVSDSVLITKYVGIASTDAFTDPLSQAKNTSNQACADGFDAVVHEHKQAWEELWDSADIEVPNNEEIQLSARSALFHLWSNIRSGYEQPGIGDTSIAPAGLTSDSYAGQVFDSYYVVDLDFLGRRYIYVSRSPGLNTRICTFN
jgi:trehalose/maltose hydrolase-like predicted phosphorylase